MVTTIIVGVDGSPDAAAAVAWVAEVAERLDARVVAVHAVGLLEHERGDPAGRHLLPRLDEWTQGLDRLPQARVERRLEQGDPVSVLCRLAEAGGGDLVVVGTRGEGAARSGLLGSTSLALAATCPCPLVVVPRGDPIGS